MREIFPNRHAVILGILLFFLSIIIVFYNSYMALLFLLAYFLLNIAYTHYLKNWVIIDVFSISAGFMLRIFAGTLGLNIPPSGWLLFCGFSLTLFLGFTKRRAELISGHNMPEYPARKVLKNYDPLFLDKLISIMASCSIISYGLYTMSPETIRIHHTQNLIYTVPLVIYGIFRYLFLLHQTRSFHTSAGEDTAKDLLTDKKLIVF